MRDRAQSAYDSGNYAEAALGFRKLIKRDTGDAESQYQLGRTYLKLRDFDRAYRAFKSASMLRPDREDIAVSLAELLFNSYSEDSRRPEPVRKELESLVARLLKINPASPDANMIAGTLQAAEGKLDAARNHLERAFAADPKRPGVVLLLLDVNVESNRSSEAEQLANEYLRRYPRENSVRDWMVRRYEGTRRLAAAEGLLKRHPGSYEAELQLAEHYLRARKTSAADSILQSFAARHAKEPAALFALGAFYQRAGQLESALHCFEQGAQIAGKESLAFHKRRLGILIAQSRWPVARKLISDLPAAQRSDVQVAHGHALILLEDERNTAAAITGLRELVDRQPNDALLRFDLGRALLRIGEMEEAQAEFDRSLRLSPTFHAPRLALASAAIARMQFDRALRHTDAVLEADPLNDSAALTRIAALRSQGRVEHARKELETLKRRAGSTITLNVESGLLAVVEGRPDKAELIFKDSFRPGMDNVRVVLGYAEALTAQGKNADAVRILEDDLASMPRRAAVRFALAETLTRRGDSKRAIAEFRRILEDDPRVDVVYERLSAIYVKQSQLAAAFELLKRGKALLPNSVAIVSSLAQVCELSGAAAEAKTAYEQWIALDRSNPTPKNNLAYLLAQEGKDLKRACELASAALRIAPKTPEYRDTLGFVYLRQGQKESARQIFQKLVTEHPKEPVFRSHYALAAGGQ